MRARLPIVTLVLIVANIGASLASLLNPDLLLTYGHRPEAVWFPAIFTSLFLHANTVHLMGNMVFLAAVGASVELGAGSVRYLVVYFLSGLAGVGLYQLATRSQPEPAALVGASGCIAGCAAYYSVRYLHMRVPFAPNKSVPVATITAIWAVLQVAGAFVNLGGETNGTAYFAHLGGLLMGLALAFVLRAPDLAEIQFGHEVLAKMNERGPVASAEASERHLQANPRDRAAWEQLVEAKRRLGDGPGEAQAILQLLDIIPPGECGYYAGRLVELEAADLLTTSRRLRLADALVPHESAVAKLLLETVVQGPEADREWPNAILALAMIEREDDPLLAQTLVRRLATHDPMHPLLEVIRKRGWII
ncbi:MAG: rhomboid family intramembrane serine protease [Fimbriimonas sp.]